jgi:hypothetical protein
MSHKIDGIALYGIKPSKIDAELSPRKAGSMEQNYKENRGYWKSAE